MAGTVRSFYPLKDIRIRNEIKPVRYLTDGELTRLYTVLESDPEMRDLVTFYLCTGARARELLPCRFGWENVLQDRIKLFTKRDKTRGVALTDEMRAILESHKGDKHPFPYSYDEV